MVLRLTRSATAPRPLRPCRRFTAAAYSVYDVALRAETRARRRYLRAIVFILFSIMTTRNPVEICRSGACPNTNNIESTKHHIIIICIASVRDYNSDGTHILRRHRSLLRILSPHIVLRGRRRRLQNSAYTSREFQQRARPFSLSTSLSRTLILSLSPRVHFVVVVVVSYVIYYNIV